MGTDKRERQKANRNARLEAERSTEKKQEATQRIMKVVIIGALVFGLLFLYSVVSGNDDDETTEIDASGEVVEGDSDEDSVAEVVTTTTEAPAADTEVMAMADPADCPAEDGSSERVTQFSQSQPMCIDVNKVYMAEVETNVGTVTVELDPSIAPQTVNNFITLARYHYYDGVTFHRIIPQFMIQGGDAVGDPAGTGGPGYSFDDELPEKGDYQIGSLAMANSGQDTQGSQFFIVTGESGVSLPPLYSLFGQVIEGMDVVSAIEATGSQSGATVDGAESSIIQGITITEK